MQSLNGQSLPQTDRAPSKRHNAKLCPLAKRQRIISALANGDSIRAIARALRVSNNTVVAIREQEWQQVAARKERLAAQAERIATLSADRLIERIPNLTDNLLIPAFGVAIDKASILRGDASLTIRHEHFHELSDDDLVAFAVARAQQRKVIDVEIVTNAPVGGDAQDTRLLAENTERKKPD